MESVLVVFSFIVNILVAGYFGLRLFWSSSPKNQNTNLSQVFGDNTPARQILACVYLSIAIMSIWALIDQTRMIDIALVLFPMQIIYKLLTLIAVKNPNNPVPPSNLAISVLHLISLIVIWL